MRLYRDIFGDWNLIVAGRVRFVFYPHPSDWIPSTTWCWNPVWLDFGIVVITSTDWIVGWPEEGTDWLEGSGDE